MSRLRRIEHADRFFFVTTNLSRGVPPLNERERTMCLDFLSRARDKHQFRLFAYVLMPDHAHLLIGVFRSSLPVLMRDWKRQSGFAIARARHIRGPVWQPRYFDFILRRVSDFGEKLDYIHQNPVSAGLVVRPEDWLWSSFGYYLDKAPVLIQPDIFDAPIDRNVPLWPFPGR